MTDGSLQLIPPHGGHRGLASYQMAEIAYVATVAFCSRFINKRSRTHDQMVQAARSGKQNIAEGCMVSGTSKKSELKLVGVARASPCGATRSTNDWCPPVLQPVAAASWTPINPSS